VIERHITFHVRSGSEHRFESFFADDYRPAMSTAPGFIRVELLRELEQPTRYQMVLRWASVEAAAGWRTSEVHQALQPTLDGLHDGTEIVGYEVVA
jgi:heme-degrading monooxygenase HmoA